MKPAILLSLVLSLPASAATTISLSPSTPKAGDSVVVTVRGIRTDGCFRTLKSAQLSGQTLHIEAEVTPCGSACPPFAPPYAIVVPAVAFAEARPYTIEYAVTDCNGKRTVEATKGVLVTPSCAFDRSLTVTPPGQAAAGDTVSFTWCDPSFSPFPDFGQSAISYRIFLVRDNDAPILVHEQSSSEGTRADVVLTNSNAGAKSAFVEALMCDITIAGCRGISSVLKSNVVPLTVAASDDCSFAGNALCLDNRFSVTARWRTASGSSPAHPVAMTKDTGNFWFFSPDNVELVVKIVDACGTATPRFWFFAAGLTDVGVDLVVRDTKTGAVRRYSTPLGSAFTPIQDTSAFTCP